MKYCVNCGRRISSSANYCIYCGEVINDKNKTDYDKEEIKKIKNKAKLFEGFAQTKTSNINKLNVGFIFAKVILWIILILALLFIVILLSQNNNGNIPLYQTSNQQDNLFTTTHTETTYGTGGAQTHTYTCPFWNRNC